LLCALETVALLLAGGHDAKPGKDANIVANQTLFAQVLLTPVDNAVYQVLGQKAHFLLDHVD